MKLKSTTLLMTALLGAWALPANAQTPNLDCDSYEEVHGFGPGGAAMAWGMGTMVGNGAVQVWDASFNCPQTTADCMSFGPIIGDDPGRQQPPQGHACDSEIDLDLDGDGLPDESFPTLGLDIPIPAGGDGEYEYGLGGAYLPDGHHGGGYGVVTVTCVGVTTDSGIACAFMAGRDGDDDGFTDPMNDPVDCVGGWYYGTPEGQYVMVQDTTDGRTCDSAGAAGTGDTGTWIFISDQVTTGDDGSINFPCPILVTDLDVPDVQVHPECVLAALATLVLPSDANPSVQVGVSGTAA